MNEPTSPALKLVPPESEAGALLARVVAKKPGAARELFDAFAPRIRRLGLRLGLGLADAEDVVQESLLIVWNRAHRVPDGDQLQGFVLGIAANHARSLLRRRHWARALGLDPGEDYEGAEECAGSSEPQSALELRRVFAVLRGMSDDLRVVFVLRFVEQLTLEEAALAAGCSLATMKRKLERARTVFVARAREDLLLWDRLSPEERDG